MTILDEMIAHTLRMVDMMVEHTLRMAELTPDPSVPPLLVGLRAAHDNYKQATGSRDEKTLDAAFKRLEDCIQAVNRASLRRNGGEVAPPP
jgi:hypothetical protein